MHSDCKVETALEILVGKWKPVILYQLQLNDTMRFSELQRAISNITQKMLTKNIMTSFIAKSIAKFLQK